MTGVVTVTGEAITNTVPSAISDNGNVDTGASVEIDVLANDSDADGDTLTIASVTQGSNGTVAITSGGVTYTHDGSGITADSFTYAASDGNGGTATGTVSITIEAASAVRNVDFTFAPLESFTISAGTTVRWTNIDTSVHNVASDPEFVGPMLGQNETFTHTFNTPGSYAYYCQVAYHGYTMFGTVTVQ